MGICLICRARNYNIFKMSGPVVQGIDTLTSAMTSNIIPDREYLLQGSILDNHVEVLTHRLRGLCNNVGAGKDEQFSEREMVFSIRVASGGPNTSAQPVTTLRVRKSELTPEKTDQNGDKQSPPWQLRYLGQPEIGEKRPTLVRSCYDIACSDNAVDFLTQLGFRLDYEFAAKGRMKITVSKIFKIVQPEPFPGGPQPATTTPATEGNLEPLSGSHLVELSVQTHSGDDAVTEDMKNFAEQLKPVIFLDKIDPRRQGLM